MVTRNRLGGRSPRWVGPTSPIGESVATPVDHPGDVLPKSQNDRRLGAAWRRLLREEEGVALVLAMLTMLVLMISLTTVIFITAAGARDAHRTNAGQKAYSLAESGINNALSVLERELRAWNGRLFPGDSTLLPPAADRVREHQLHAPVDNCVTWSGTLAGPLVSAATTPWKYEWRLTATGSVRNPTGPAAAAVSRTVTAIVPVVIPPTSPASGTGPLNFLYPAGTSGSRNRCTSRRRSTSRATCTSNPTVAGRRKLRQGKGRDRPGPLPEEPRRTRSGSPEAAIRGSPSSTSCISALRRRPRRCTTAGRRQPIGTTTRSSRPSTTTSSRRPASFISFIPKLTCCAPFGGRSPRRPSARPPDTRATWATGTRTPISGRSRPARRPAARRPKFDTASGVPDNSINWSATPTTVINLTPGASYTCKSMAGSTTWRALLEQLHEIADRQGDDLHRRQHHHRDPGGDGHDTPARRRSSPRARSG